MNEQLQFLKSAQQIDLHPIARSSKDEDIRRRSLERFFTLGFPHRKVEAWRFTKVDDLGGRAWTPAKRSPLVETTSWLEEGSFGLSIVNGFVQGVRFGTDAKRPVLCGLKEGISNYPELLKRCCLASQERGRPFASLNEAFHQDGAFVWVPAGLEVETVIELHYLTKEGSGTELSFPRSLIVLEEGAKAEIIEVHHAQGAAVAAPVTHISLAKGAQLRHRTLHEESKGATVLSTRLVEVEESGRYESTDFHLGVSRYREEIDVALLGEGANAALSGLLGLRGVEHCSNQILVRHEIPRTYSSQHFKAVLGEHSHGVFTGRVRVAQDAQEVEAEQSNQSLLLSRDALVNSNPQLEIYADDVRCSHGSTVGELDNDAIFYLRTRGIPEQQARALLTRAFAQEIVDKLEEDSPLRARVERSLARLEREGAANG